jgi:hypothetical protein
MTPEDAEQITVIVAAAEQRTALAIAAAKAETVEAMRDMQTEILRGIEAFARGNFARMNRLESSDATTQRLAAIEDRLLALEMRQRPPQ